MYFFKCVFFFILKLEEKNLDLNWWWVFNEKVISWNFLKDVKYFLEIFVYWYFYVIICCGLVFESVV